MKKLLACLISVLLLLIVAVPAIAADPSLSEIEDPVAGLGSLGDIITKALPIVFALVGLLAVVIFTVGAFRYMTSRGDPKAAEAARGTITGSVIGLVIVLGAASLSGVFEQVFGISFFGSGNAVLSLTRSTNVVDLTCAFVLATSTCVGVQYTNFADLITYILLLLLAVGALVFFFMLIWGGIRYMLSRGDEKAVTDARSTLTNAFVGLLLMISALVIIRIIASILFDYGGI